jgi:hypothetical protein
LRNWEPTVAPIWASSPAAWTAVVTISVPRGRPFAERGGEGGGGAGRWAAAAFGWVAATGDRLAFAFLAAFVACAPEDFVAAFVACAPEDFVVLAFVAAFVSCGPADFVALAFVAAVARDRSAARRSPPRRIGRVERTLPRTLSSAPDFALFFDFFLEDFCVMATVNGQSGRRPL